MFSKKVQQMNGFIKNHNLDNFNSSNLSDLKGPVKIKKFEPKKVPKVSVPSPDPIQAPQDPKSKKTP